VGCDVWWSGSLKSAKQQKKIALFLSCIFEALDIDYDVYSGSFRPFH